MSEYDIKKMIDTPPAGYARVDAFFTAKANTVYAILPRWPGSQATLRKIPRARRRTCDASRNGRISQMGTQRAEYRRHDTPSQRRPRGLRPQGRDLARMVLIQSLPLAILLCIVTMLGWGSWANTQKLAGKEKWPFELFYWDYAIGVFLFSLIFAATLGTLGSDGPNVFQNHRAGGTRLHLAPPCSAE